MEKMVRSLKILTLAEIMSILLTLSKKKHVDTVDFL